MVTLFVNVQNLDTKTVQVNLESFIILNVYKHIQCSNISVKVLQKDVEFPLINVNSNDLKFEYVLESEINETALSLQWPVLEVNANLVIAGVCSVARHLIKESQNEEFSHLLGFRESCLTACSESSIWTKFCEIDMISTAKSLLNTSEISDKLPDDFLRFEYHLKQPVKVHNVYKLARERQKDNSIASSVLIKSLNIPHCYSEGPHLTLADLILRPSIDIACKIYSEDTFKKYLPLTFQWLQRTQEVFSFEYTLQRQPEVNNTCLVINSNLKEHSLYASDPNRYRPQSRPFTKQNNVESAVKLAKENLHLRNSSLETFGKEIELNWNTLPLIIRPEGGALPKKRSKRKEEQLESLAKATIKVVNEMQRKQTIEKPIKIVDFCSGSGHLGLLLAVLLPECDVYLVENKEKSLVRALDRMNKLCLKNVKVLQSNLDYFKASFDVGVALHACGLATDLVIQNCIDNKAHFICCPCCYGGIHDSYHISFPRSNAFLAVLNSKEYFCIAHAADQTHDNENAKTQQGYECMDIIDTDRLLHATCLGYDVSLSKLFPENCTPKNNLLVGIHKL